jgi:hypothetical protein
MPRWPGKQRSTHPADINASLREEWSILLLRPEEILEHIKQLTTEISDLNAKRRQAVALAPHLRLDAWWCLEHHHAQTMDRAGRVTPRSPHA